MKHTSRQAHFEVPLITRTGVYDGRKYTHVVKVVKNVISLSSTFIYDDGTTTSFKESIASLGFFTVDLHINS